MMYFSYGHNRFCRMRGAPASGGTAPPLTLADISFVSAATAEASFQLDLANAKAHLLIDLGGADAPAGTNVVLPVCTANIVAVGSPSACASEPVRAWVSKMTGLERRYLPVVPLTVLEECRRLICPTQAEETADRALPTDNPRALLRGEAYRAHLDKVVFDLRSERYGGNPRSCIDTTDAELDERLREVLDKCPLKTIVKETRDGKLDGLHRYSSMLLHYRVFDSEPLTVAERQRVHLAESAKRKLISEPAACAALAAQRPEALPFCLRDPSLQFASDWMKERLYEKYQAQRQLEISEFLHDCLSNPALFSVRHDFFESHAHAIMRRGGLRLNTQQLDPNTGVRLGSVTQTLFTVTGAPHSISQLSDFSNLNLNQYARPSKSDWPTLDAVIEPNMTLQYTTADTHSVVEGGLYDAEAQLHALATARATGAAATAVVTGAPAPPAGPPFRLKHYFGVPPDRFRSFVLKSTNFTPTLGKPRPANVDYYVVSVEDPEVTAERRERKVANRAHTQCQGAAAKLLMFVRSVECTVFVCFSAKQVVRPEEQAALVGKAVRASAVVHVLLQV